MHTRLLMVLLATAFITHGDTVTWHDDFESSDFRVGNWKPADKNAIVTKIAADTGKYGVQLAGSTGFERAMNASGFKNIRIAFSFRTELLDREDRILVDWYDGDRWHRVGSEISSEWKRVSYKLGSGANNNPYVKIRVRLSTIAYKGAAYFDDFVILSDTDGSRPPVAPEDCVPPHEATNVSVRQKLTWHAGIDADGYEFIITKDISKVRKSRIEMSGTLIRTNSIRPGTLAGGTTYYWQVNAFNKNGSVLGPIWQFTTTEQPDPGSAKPTANAGGPYAAQPGETIYLDASGSTDPDDDIVAYDWDLDGDGEFDDAIGPRYQLSERRTGARMVHVRVRDAAGATDVASAVISVKLDDVIDWVNEQNVTIEANTVRKLSGKGWSAGAFSHRALTEDGHLAVRGSWGGKRMVGLARRDMGPQPFGIDYAFYMNDRLLEIFERGQQRGSYGGFRPGEELRIEIQEGDVIYWRGEEELRRVEGAVPRSGFSFNADMSIETVNAEIQRVRLVMPPPEPPKISAYNATDPDNLDTFYSGGDSVLIRFHRATNMAGFEAGHVVDQNMVDRLFSFNPPPGNRYQGKWLSNEVFEVEIIEASPVEPGIGAATVSVAGRRPILHSRMVLPAGSSTSPPLGGNWGSIMVHWTAGQHVRIDGQDVMREQRREGWDSGARSHRTMGDGAYFETVVNGRGKSRMIGITKDLGDYHFRALHHAFFLHASGALEAFQDGAQRGNLGQYAAGDVLRMEIHGKEIHYLRNGRLLRKALVDPAKLPAHVGVVIQSPGGRFLDTKIVLPDPPVPHIAEFVASDHDASEAGFTANDTITIIFDRPTNRPEIPMTELFEFVPPLAGEFSGRWIDARRYRITGTGTAPTIGAQAVAPKGDIYHAGSQVRADTSAVSLSGSYQHNRDPLPVVDIRSTTPDPGLWQLVNGSGLRGARHDNNPDNMWLAESANPNFRVDLGEVCSVAQIAIWNRNSGGGDAMGRVEINVSLDGEIWSPIGNLQLRSGDGTTPIPADYVTINSDCRYLSVGTRSATPVGLSELRIFGRPSTVHSWIDPRLRATISNGALEAVIQGGRLCELRNSDTGAAFVRIAPESLPGSLAGINFTAANTIQSATANSVTTVYSWPAGNKVRVTWSLAGNELQLSTEAPITRLPGIDIVNHKLVTLDFHGYGHTHGRHGRQRPLALVEGKEGGWIVTSQDAASFDRYRESISTSAKHLRIRAYHGDWREALVDYRAEQPLTPVGKRAGWIRSITKHQQMPSNDVIPAETLLGPIRDPLVLGTAVAMGYRAIADVTHIGLEEAVEAGASVLLVNLHTVTEASERYPNIPLMVRGLPAIDVSFALLDRDMGHPLGGYLLQPYRKGISTRPVSLDLDQLIR